MLKNISNLGTILNKAEQKSINGGYSFCIIHGFSDLVDCQDRGGEVVDCDPRLDCNEIEP